eukprot:2216013-Amphidinium_carterae.1
MNASSLPALAYKCLHGRCLPAPTRRVCLVPGIGLAELPPSLAQCQQLAKLEISANPNLQSLPDVIAAP